MTTQTRIPSLDLSALTESLWPGLLEAAERVLRSNRYILGAEVQAFEEEMARYLGVAHAVACNSGTDALLLGLRALGVGPGDEVITTPFTFFATPEAISNVGARPVFVDIDPDTFNLDPARVEAAITPRTRAILPVHLFGRPCDLGRILEVAERHGLQVLEDCAQALGARYAGRPVGTFGLAGAFSFFPTKNLPGCGDGGMLVTQDDAVAQTARMLRVHGSRRKYHNEALGYNSRLDELQAALLRVKLPHLDAWNEARRHAALTYQEFLQGAEGIRLPEICEGHAFNQYTVRLRDRDALQKRLGQEGIDTMVYYPVPCHRLKVYEGTHAGVSCPEAERVSGEVLSLPFWPGIDEDVQAVVASTLNSLAGGG